MKTRQTLVPDYYPDFHCIGSDCEDSCCAGWTVPINRDTYNRYKQHKNPVLAPLFREFVQKNRDSATQSEAYYGLMELKPDGSCGFLREDKLCAIQKELGAQALCNTCALYPRQVNRFGGQPEQSLNISCPEAARLALLRPETITFAMIDGAPRSHDTQALMRRFPENHDGVPEEIDIFRELRLLSIRILQHRRLTIDARLMLVGMVMENADRVITAETYTDASELSPVIEFGDQVLQHYGLFNAEFMKLAANQPFKLKMLGSILRHTLADQEHIRFSQCLDDALSALFAGTGEDGSDGADILGRYEAAYINYYLPFFQGNEYIFENYLVNEVFRQMFPLMNSSPFRLYQELVCNYAIAKLLLVGMAGRHKGLNDALVVKLFQSFSRKASHNRAYLQCLLDLLHVQNSESLVHMMWLLREQDR